MKMDPIKHVRFVTWLLIAVLLFHVFILDRHEGPTALSFSLIYLVIAISPIYSAFKYLQKRIEALEEELNEQKQSEN